MFRNILLGALGLAVAAGVYVRLAPVEAEVWHVDPDMVERTGKPNDYLVAPGGDREPVELPEAPDALLAKFEGIVLSDDGTSKLAGDAAEGVHTYVQRSRLVGYPDMISVKIAATPDGSRLSIYSRSRFGHSDLGVNKDRVARWLLALEMADTADQ